MSDDLSVSLYESPDFSAAVELISSHPVMEELEVDEIDQVEVVEYLKEHGAVCTAGILASFTLDEFENFLVNECGE